MAHVPPATTRARHVRPAPNRRTPTRATFAVGGVLALVAGGLTGAAVDGPVSTLVPWLSGEVSAAPPGETSPAPTTPTPEPIAEPSPTPAPTTARPTPSPTPTLTPDPDAVDAPGLTLADREAGLLSLQTPASASGELVVVPGSQDAPATGAPVRLVRVEVERGLDIEQQAFARTVMTALNDPRGWGADGSVTFARTDGDADYRVVLASPSKVDAMCAPLRTSSLYSCGRYGHAALNHMRWVKATDEFDDLTQYRHYLVNHEVGHLLGQPHVSCPAAGELAPIMQQQTIRVAPCLANAWPFPEAG